MQNGHLAALQEVIFAPDDKDPFWYRFSGRVEFQEELVMKVPKWLYIKFRNTPPIIEVSDAAREAVGIFEP